MILEVLTRTPVFDVPLFPCWLWRGLQNRCWLGIESLPSEGCPYLIDTFSMEGVPAQWTRSEVPELHILSVLLGAAEAGF